MLGLGPTFKHNVANHLILKSLKKDKTDIHVLANRPAVTQKLFFPLDLYFPCGIMERVLEPVPAAYGQRQGTPQDETPAHCRAIFS